MAQNGPKWPKIAPKSPQRPLLIQYGYTLSHTTCFGAIHAFMGQKMDSKLAKTGPNLIASIGGPKMPGQWEEQLFQLLPTYIYIGEGIFAKKYAIISLQCLTRFLPPVLFSMLVLFEENCDLRLFPLIPDLTVNCSGPRTPVQCQIHWSWLCELFFFVTTLPMNRDLLILNKVLLLIPCCSLTLLTDIQIPPICVFLIVSWQ